MFSKIFTLPPPLLMFQTHCSTPTFLLSSLTAFLSVVTTAHRRDVNPLPLAFHRHEYLPFVGIIHFARLDTIQIDGAAWYQVS
jgi:hypothetical protein